MGVLSRVVGDHLNRTDAWFIRSQAWTRAFWLFIPYNSFGVGAGFFTNYEDFDDLPHTHMIGSYSYVDPAYDATRMVVDTELMTGAALTFIDYSEVLANSRDAGGKVDGEWHYVCQTYNPANAEWNTYFDLTAGRHMLQDMSAFPGPYNNPQEWLNGTGAPNAGQGYAYYRVWQATLTISELSLEMINRRAVRTANLLADTPLESIADVTDKSGNGRNWGLSGSWVNCVDPLMPVSEVQFINNNTATGTTGVTLTKPTNTADNDTMFIGLTHKGLAFATMPAGWTAIKQVLTGTLRVELWYRRANAEGASYAVTGLADTAAGTITTFRNVATDLLDQLNSVSYTNISSNSSAFAVADIATRVYGSLVLTVGGMSLNRFVNGLAFGDGFENDPPRPWSVGGAINNASGTGCSICTLFGTKVFAGNINPTTPYGFNTASGGIVNITDAVSITVSIVPEATLKSSPTRWYLTNQSANDVMTRGACQGTWAAGVSDRDNRAYYGDKSLLAPMAMLNGSVGQQFAPIVTGAGAGTPYESFGTKFISERLAAGTSSGTFQITLPIRKSSTFSVTAKLRVHVYVCRGSDLTNVVGTLLANYTDTVLLTTSDNWIRLAAAQNLAAVTWQDGDRVVVEVGVEATANVGTQATAAFMRQGCASAGGTALDDGPSSGAYSGTNPKACYMDFSAGLPILPYRPPRLFTNYIRTKAQLVTSLPFATGELDTRRVPSPNRVLWYQWTADFTGQIVCDNFGTVQGAGIDLFIGASTTAIPFNSVGGEWGAGPWAGVGQNTAFLNVTKGTQYFFALYPRGNGGATRLRISKVQAPQNDDIFLSCQHNIGFRYRPDSNDLEIININSDFYNQTPTGVAIDQSHTPIWTTNFGAEPKHISDRLIFGIFTSGGLVEVIDLTTMNKGSADEVNFYDGDVLGFNSDFTSAIVMDRAGNIYAGFFGDGYTVIGSVSSVGSYDILKFNVTDVELQPGTATPATAIRPAPDREGSDYIDLDSTNTVMFYTSAGQKVKRIRVTDSVQLADFAAAVPIAPGPRPYLRGLRLLPPGDGSGGLLVANGSRVERLDASGAVIQSYSPVTSPAGASSDLDKAELLSDRRRFWVSDQYSTMLFLFDLETGVQLAAVETFLPGGQFSGFDVYGGYRAGLDQNCPPPTLLTAGEGGAAIVTTPPAAAECVSGAVSVNAAADGLSRTAFLSFTSDWTIGGWFKPTSDLAPGTGATLWVYGLLPSGPGLPQIYLYLFFDSGVISLNFGAQVLGPSVDVDFGVYVMAVEVWRYVTVTYNAATHALTLYRDAVLLQALSLDLSTAPFTQTEFLLHDQNASILGGAAGSQFRVWQRILSTDEMLTEKAKKRAVSTENLLADTPLSSATDLADVSGNNRGWTALGTLADAGGPVPVITAVM